MTIIATVNDDETITFDWDENDPVDSVLNTWTEQDFMDAILNYCKKLWVRKSTTRSLKNMNNAM